MFLIQLSVSISQWPTSYLHSFAKVDLPVQLQQCRFIDFDTKMYLQSPTVSHVWLLCQLLTEKPFCKHFQNIAFLMFLF